MLACVSAGRRSAEHINALTFTINVLIKIYDFFLCPSTRDTEISQKVFPTDLANQTLIQILVVVFDSLN